VDWGKVKAVILEDGSYGRVIEHQDHKYGCDLRVVATNGEEFWIDSSNIAFLETE
jgi:hypothetical protein